MKKLFCTFIFTLLCSTLHAQTAEELKKEQAPKKAEIAKLQGEVDALQSKIDALSNGWKKGAFGTIGGSLSGFSNWYSKSAPNSSAGNIGITVNAFANLIEDKYFWRNSMTINLGWVKLDDESISGDEDFETATDVFTISSLYGKKLNEKWAVSGLGEYRTTIINNFNDPGYLDIGMGVTWTPTSSLVVVMHPANYNIIFSSLNNVYSSSPGAKIVADYTTALAGVNLKSNLSMFQSYDGADLSNWTWTNSLGYTLWKGIGIGFELGLRDNKQEALGNAMLKDSGATFSTIENKTQSYWLFGINYSL